MTAEQVIQLLDLKPLPEEGGYYCETYRAVAQNTLIQGDAKVQRSLGTCIYYLLTPDQFSGLHRLRYDEIFHFYAGDPVEMLSLAASGKSEVIRLGSRFDLGQKPQHVVSAETWQGTRLAEGGSWALLGTTMAPGFDFADFDLGLRADLTRQYPDRADFIQKLTRG
jgi:predicted cupin superfamily sugar epimerase